MEQTYAQALALCRELPETPDLCSALAGLETDYFARGELRTAHDLAQQCLALAALQPDAVRRQQAHQAMGAPCPSWANPGPRTHLERAIAVDEVDRYQRVVAPYGTYHLARLGMGRPGTKTTPKPQAVRRLPRSSRVMFPYGGLLRNQRK